MHDQLQELFTDWNKTELQSFLIEITATVLAKKDEETGHPLVDMILDKAKQKGTGKWTSQSAMDLNVPLPTIDVAVSMRYLSAMKEDRINAAPKYAWQKNNTATNKQQLISLCKNALHVGFLLSYAQGLQLLSVASSTYKYAINIAEVIRIWKGGCIIRSVLLNDLRQSAAGLKLIEQAIAFGLLGKGLLKRQKATAVDLFKLKIAAIPDSLAVDDFVGAPSGDVVRHQQALSR